MAVLPQTLPIPRNRGDSKRRTGVSRLQLSARQLIQNPRLLLNPKPLASIIIATVVLLFLAFRPTSRSTHAQLQWGAEPKNWGDHVGLGLGRAKIVESTPPSYADLGDHLAGIKGELYKGRKNEVAHLKDKVAKARTTTSERDRHGTLGGGSVEWSSGVIGVGTFLGQVDMRKQPPTAQLAPVAPGPALTELASHIRALGWTFEDDKARDENALVLEQMKEKGRWDELPLKDRVRGDEQKMEEAAMGWSRMYGAMDGEWCKSALEVAVEKTVRSVPVVVFSKTTCPHSQRAKEILAKLKLSSPPHIVEVDQRPDAKQLKGLLTRRTLHSTFPNIIIGGRSIGGADDLTRMEADGSLAKLLDDLTGA